MNRNLAKSRAFYEKKKAESKTGPQTGTGARGQRIKVGPSTNCSASSQSTSQVSTPWRSSSRPSLGSEGLFPSPLAFSPGLTRIPGTGCSNTPSIPTPPLPCIQPSSRAKSSPNAPSAYIYGPMRRRSRRNERGCCPLWSFICNSRRPSRPSYKASISRPMVRRDLNEKRAQM